VKSIYVRILLWVFATLTVALGLFIAISNYYGSRAGHKIFGAFNELQRDQAIEAYEAGGPRGLNENLRKLEKYFPGEHFLSDSKGKDLISGSDHSELLEEARERGTGRPKFRSRLIFAIASKDGRYWFFATAPPPFTPSSFVFYYVLILGVVAALCWVLALYIGVPLRDLARTVERFGRGDLTARANLSRSDEIGQMARAFDRMGDRIQTLLTAERRLLSDISHELRSPLARLSFATELLRTADDREAAAARIRKEIARLTVLVGSLLEMTRAEGDPGSRRFEPIDLSELLDGIANDCRVEADAKRCRVDLATSPLEIAGDHELLRRAIENVVRNAIRYAPEGSAIQIGATAQKGSATVTVRDHGPGVPEEALARIFTPFYRVDASRDSSTGGVGLGLAIASRAILLHQGRISAANAGPGLVVTIELPLK
jgi:two-component system sensor histidine kinase CpxA